MKKLSALCLVGLLSLGGCQFFQPVVNPVDMVTAEKSLTVAHYAYQGLGTAILEGTKTGLLKGQNASQVRVYFDKAGDALDVADKADSAANEPNLIAAVSQFNDAVTQAKKLMGGN